MLQSCVTLKLPSGGKGKNMGAGRMRRIKVNNRTELDTSKCLDRCSERGSNGEVEVPDQQ